MYMYRCTFMYIFLNYLFVYIWICVHMYICIYMYMYICIYLYLCVRICVNRFMWMYVLTLDVSPP